MYSSFLLPGWLGNLIKNDEYIADNCVLFRKSALSDSLLDILSDSAIGDDGINVAPRTIKSMKLDKAANVELQITREWRWAQDRTGVKLQSSDGSLVVWLDHAKLGLVNLVVQYDSIYGSAIGDPVVFQKDGQTVAIVAGLAYVEESLIESINAPGREISN